MYRFKVGVSVEKQNTNGSGTQTLNNARQPCTRQAPRFELLYAGFILAAILGAIPRCIALLLIRTMDQVDVSTTVSSFKQLWAVCKEPSTTFSEHSPGGAVFKAMVISDHFFYYLGLCIAFHAAVSILPSFNHRVGRLLDVGVLTLQPINGIVAFGSILSRFFQSDPSTADMLSGGGIRSLFTVAMQLLFTMYCVIVLFLNWRYRPSTDTRTSWLLLVKANGVFFVTVSMILTLTSLVNDLTGLLQRMVGDYMGLILQLILSKCLLILLRNTTWRSRSRDANHLSGSLHIVTMLTFLLATSVGMATRRTFRRVGNDSLMYSVYASLGHSVVELMSRFFLASSHLLRSALVIQEAGLNTCTLHQIVQRAHTLEQYVDMNYTFLWVDQFAEISVIMVIAAQDLCRPIWSASEHLHQTSWMTTLCILGIQLGIEVGVDWCVLYTCYRTILRDPTTALLRTVSTPMLMTFFFGITIWHSLTFWPRCQLCKFPTYCLYFTECLRDGVVMINGSNFCQNSVRHTEEFTLKLMEMTQMKTTDLACERADVDCWIPK
mmetsp:Transcript_30045/g.48432  ORF Transcript_30045/g.48432 Transcript_30045/m.48432 type:complete len:549 (+) Transcript_30045:328-1974(+)